MAYIKFDNVQKKYIVNTNVSVTAVKKANFEIEKGEFVVILGASGAGKTTVLNLLGGMDNCSSGSIKIDEEEISSLSKFELTLYRRNNVGFVFQFYNLIPNLTAQENVELATEICKNPLPALEVINSVGLNARTQNFPSQLSGGEQQRVSIARAVAKNPKILLCDEPTGALDSKTGKSILKLLKKMSQELNKTVIVVTHNAELAKVADRVISMKDGEISSVILQENSMDCEELIW